MDEVFGAANFVGVITFQEDERRRERSAIESATISFGTPRIVASEYATFIVQDES